MSKVFLSKFLRCGTDIWGKRLLLCIFSRPIKIRCIFFCACIKNYHLSQKTTDDNSIASKEKKNAY